jgi:Tfp pilus assembly protein PilX
MRPTPHSKPRGESGVAMIVVVGVLAIVGALSAAALTVAIQTNGSTRRDANAKEAAEAAEAGLQVATYRLNMLEPPAGQCVSSVIASPAANGYCQGPTESLGNGATYSYVTSPVLGPGTSCVGLPVINTVQPLSQRCITSTGTSNGVSARAQTRIAAFGGTPLFGPNAIIGVKSVTIADNAAINGQVYSGGTLTLDNNATTSSYELGPNGTISVSNGASSGPGAQLTNDQGPLQLGQVSVGNSAIDGSPTDTTSGHNFDWRITNYVTNPSNPTAPYDTAPGVSFNPTTRVLSMGNNATLTLGGGIYNFCEFDTGNNDTITLAPGVKTEVFIDSPDDPNSGIPGSLTNPPCAPGTGNLNLRNNTSWINNYLTNGQPDSTALQIYVYGFNDGSNVINLQNNTIYYGLLYAPQSTINISHSSTNSQYYGRVAGDVVNVTNNLSFNQADDGNLQEPLGSVYHRTAWAQCVPSPTTSDPGSGCG